MTCDGQHKIFDTKNGEKEIFRSVCTREMRRKDLNGVRCNKDANQSILVKEKMIKERCTQKLGYLMVPPNEVNRSFIRRTREYEVKGASKKIKEKNAT